MFYINNILNPASHKLDFLSSPVTSLPVSLTLNLANPDDNIFVTSPDLLIAGKTSPNTLVLISQDKKDLTLFSSNKGEFSTTLSLTEGVNGLSVNVFDDTGNSKSEVRTVYYTTDKI